MENPKIHELVQLFHDYQWAYNFKMTELLFDENLQKVPADIRSYFANFGDSSSSRSLDKSSIESIANAIVHGHPKVSYKICYCAYGIDLKVDPFQECDESMPDILRTFVQKVHDFSNVERALDVQSDPNIDYTRMPRKWSEKKLEEVEYLAQFVHGVCGQFDCDTIIDIGSGLVSFRRLIYWTD
jgi:hypothetical protein